MNTEFGNMREDIGSIKSTVEGLKETMDAHVKTVNEGFSDDRKRIRKLEDWKLKAVLIVTVIAGGIGTVVSFGWNWFIRQ